MLPRNTTPSEWAVLYWFIVILFIVVGVAALVMGLRAPVEKHDVAIELEHRGLWLMGAGCIMAVGRWLARRILD